MQHYCRVLWRTEGAWLEMHGPNTQIITGLRFSDTSWTTTNSINTWNNVLSLSENIKDIKGIMNVCALLPVISCLQIHPALSLSVWTIDPAALVKCHCYNYWNSTSPHPHFAILYLYLPEPALNLSWRKVISHHQSSQGFIKMVFIKRSNPQASFQYILIWHPGTW